MPFYTSLLRRPFILALFLLGATLGVAGCSGPREATGTLPDSYPNDSFEDIRGALAYGNDTLQSFEAQARLSVDTPAQSGSFSSTVRARRGPHGDSLSMTLSKFGIQGGRILVTPDSFFVYDAVRSELTYGALADAGARLPAPLRSGRAFENLLGLVVPQDGLRWEVRPAREAGTGARYVLNSSDGGRVRTLAVDPTRWRALRYAEETSGGTLVEERAFSEFGRFGGVFIPRRVALRRPQEESSATIYYEDLTLNPERLPPFTLEVPEGVERIRLGR